MPHQTTKLQSVRPNHSHTSSQIDWGYELTRGIAANMIRYKARVTAKRIGYSKSEIDDLQQQFIQRVLENVDSFDPTQSKLQTFVKTIVDRAAVNIVRNALAAKRDPNRVVSLENFAEERAVAGVTQASDSLANDDLDNRLGRESLDNQAALELTIDVAATIAQLPPALRDLCERLKHYSLSDVARQLNMPRTTLQSRIQQLREHFAAVGLRENS